jgi:hypothetical protein
LTEHDASPLEFFWMLRVPNYCMGRPLPRMQLIKTAFPLRL